MKARRFRWLVVALVNTPARLPGKLVATPSQLRVTLSSHTTEEVAIARMVAAKLSRDDLEWVVVVRKRVSRRSRK